MNDIALSQKRSKTRIFNPHRLKSNELEESFIARQELFHSILDDLASGKSKSPPQHQLVIGQRGMGKTTLLLRLALELHREPYCQHLLPLNFPEEQYIEVDRLSKFWLNCLDATADALEYEGKMEVVTQIDGEVQRLSQMQTDETTYHESCREAFTAVWKRLGRRPVLFIDNFNLLLSRLRKEDFSLRGYFSAPGAPVLVAASTVYPDEMADYGAAFYDGFKPHYLHPLTLDEVRDVLIRLAQSVGQPVLVDRIYRELPRLAALRDLTGGNPRTAVLLFELFADGFSEDAFEDLDALLDLITPLYQSRLEQLSDLAQTIVGTLARNWSPMSKADIVSQARLVDSSVPAQLGRLREIGLVEETPLFPSKKMGYQIAERFFNIWYLMRFASRRQRASLACLTRFLEEFHTPAERTRSARELLQRDGLTRGNITYAMALAGSLQGEPALARDLEWKAQLELIEQMQGVRARIADILDPDEIPHAVYSFAVLKQRLEQAVPADSPISGPAFARLVLGSPSLVPGGIDKPTSGDRTSIAAAKLTAKKVEELVKEFEMEAVTIGQQFSTKCFEWLKSRLNAGTLTNWRDPIGLSSLILLAEDEESLQLVRKFGHPEAKRKLSENSFEKLCSMLNLRPSAKTNAFNWAGFGYELHIEFDRYPEAEQAYREATRIDPNFAYPWNNLGSLLSDHLARYPEAEQAYREAIRIDPNFAKAWSNLAFLLRDHRHDHTEAKSILRELRQPDEWRDTQALHEALFAAYEDDWPQISKSMKEALALIEGRLPSNTRDDWFRASAVLLHLGFGERLVGLLKECGADVTFMPWFAAVQAHTLGDKRHLVNIPLEARPAAEQIFDQIDQRRQQLPPPSK
jgi:tetratricopeptide (TPR) repeat protein